MQVEQGAMGGRFHYRQYMRFFGRLSQSHEGRSGSGSDVADVLAVAASRIDEIVAASERAADDIRRESSAKLGLGTSEGSQISRERLVAELAESLVERAESLSREAADLAGLLGRASGRLLPKDEPPASPEPATASVPTATPARSSTPDLDRRVSERFVSGDESRTADKRGSKPFKRRSGASDPQTRKRPSPNDGLKLLVSQMAVAGSTRDEIEARLRTEFGVEDASSLLGDVRVAAS